MVLLSENKSLDLPRFVDVDNMHPSSKRAVVRDLGLTTMTEIQAKTFEAASSGRDILGRARTGTGKTLAFLLPAIETLLKQKDFEPGKDIGVLILSPTRDNFSLVNTLCSPSHEIWGWCCKTACEIVYYYEHSDADWMCHLDDGTYLNYPAMIKYLQQFDAKEEHYIGFSSPIDETWLVEKRRTKLMDKAVSAGRTLKSSTYVATKLKDGNVVGKVDERKGVRVPLFGTGGAGWCLSRPLVERGIDDFANLQSDCFKKAYPDDVMLGYAINEKLGVNMKQEPLLNSHLDAQYFASREEALQQLTLGLGNRTKIGNGQPKDRVFTFPSWPGSSFVDKKTGRPRDDDPLGFRELHCALYPDRCR